MTQPVGAAIRPANLTSKEARRLVERVCASMEDARGAILELREQVALLDEPPLPA